MLKTVDIHDISTQHFLQDINLDVETYMDALEIIKRGPNVILQQNPQDVLTNVCIHDIISIWRGNVDLQCVTNEIATVKYVCSYMPKGAYDVLQSATKTEEIYGINDEEEEMQNAGNDKSVTRMKLQKGLGIIRKRKQEAIL